MDRAVLAIVAVAAIAAAGFILERELRQQPGAVIGVFELAGDQRPVFTAVSLEGDPVSPAAYKGRVLVVDLWATWCPACCDKLAKYERLAQRYRGRGVQFVAFTLDDTADIAGEWANSHHISIPIAMMNDNVQRALFPEDECLTIPQVRVMDRTGRLRYAVQPESRARDLEVAIEKVLAEP